MFVLLCRHEATVAAAIPRFLEAFHAVIDWPQGSSMTNLISFLHTTAPYQAAVLQLLIAEANFTAEQLGISERLPAERNQLRVAEVGPVPRGVSGAVGGSNYVFGFDHGHLRLIRKVEWQKQLNSTGTNLNRFSNHVSRIDTNGAYRFATQWLGKLSVDVPALNQRFSPQVVQLPFRTPGIPLKVPIHQRLLRNHPCFW